VRWLGLVRELDERTTRPRPRVFHVFSSRKVRGLINRFAGAYLVVDTAGMAKEPEPLKPAPEVSTRYRAVPPAVARPGEPQTQHVVGSRRTRLTDDCRGCLSPIRCRMHDHVPTEQEL
jgi:hypothetical protein